MARLDEAELSLVRRHPIGFVFQFFHLVPRLTALENVELPMVFAGIPAGERRERATGRLRDVGLEPRASHRPDQLSGGERQRVAIARAIVIAPAPARRRAHRQPRHHLGRHVLELLERMNAAGLTLVVVTHDPAVARRARRVLVLKDGRVVAAGTARTPRGGRILLRGGARRVSLRDLLGFAARRPARPPPAHRPEPPRRGHRRRRRRDPTALGEGARRYVVGQFASLGTNLLIVVPGKIETTGGMPGVGGVPNDLTLEDARALLRGSRGREGRPDGRWAPRPWPSRSASARWA